MIRKIPFFLFFKTFGKYIGKNKLIFQNSIMTRKVSLLRHGAHEIEQTIYNGMGMLND